MELSTICGLDIHIVIFDKAKHKKVEYKSTNDFDFDAIDAMRPEVELEYYDNSDYDELMNKFTKKEQLKKIQEKHQQNRNNAKNEQATDKILQNVLKKRNVKVVEKEDKISQKSSDLFKVQKVDKGDEATESQIDCKETAIPIQSVQQGHSQNLGVQ